MDLDVFSTLPKNPDPSTGKNPVVPHVVRTFSRDAATVQNTPNVSVPQPPKPPQTKAAPAIVPVPVPPHAVVNPSVGASPKSVWLSAPSVEVATPVPPPQPVPSTIITAPSPSIADLSTKDEILERLRVKAESRASASDALLFETVGESTTPKNTSPFIPRKEVLPDAGKSPVPLSPTGASPLHTYRLDFAGRIRDKKASPFTILAAEQDSKKLHEAIQTDSRRRKIWYIAGALLIVLGGGGGYATYHVMSGTPLFSIGNVPSLIFADEQKRVEGTAIVLQHAIAKNASDETVPRGAVRVLFASVSSTTPNGTVITVVAGNALFAALELPAPSILTRNIEPQTTIGVINAGDETRPFFILKVSSYGSTFSGMLLWEKTMPTDLALFYPPYPAAPASPAPTIATTTPTVPIIPGPRIHPEDIVGFSDGTVANNSVRILSDRAGRTIMLYGYRDKTTLIIAGNEGAFAEIIHRLAATSQQ